MRAWTLEQVWQLAPDGSSASAARGLAAAAKWRSLGRAETLIWGLCQGSGKDPYRAAFDYAAAVYKCSCPSRKQPCKHALALLAVQVQSPAAFADSAPPEWVAEWSSRRAERAARTAAPAERPPPDPQQAQKRADARRDKMREGLAELRLWLHDLARQGLAARKGGLPAELQARARRLIDAQCPGPAASLQELAGSLSVPDADDLALSRLARLDLLCGAFERLDQLPDGLQADVRVALGWPIAQEQVLAQPGWQGDWLVLGVAEGIDADERVRSQHVWLREEAGGRIALLLQYAFGTQAFARVLPPLSRWRGELCPYPSAWPLRVALKDLQPLPPGGPATMTVHAHWSAALDHAAAAFAANPFLVQVPLLIQGRPWPQDAGWWLVDEQDRALPMVPSATLWSWLSECGSSPVNWFGEWDGCRFRALMPFAAAGMQA